MEEQYHPDLKGGDSMEEKVQMPDQDNTGLMQGEEKVEDDSERETAAEASLEAVWRE